MQGGGKGIRLESMHICRMGSWIIRKFGKPSTFGTKSTTLEMPTNHKAKKRLVKTWYNPYIYPEKVTGEKERIKRESLFSYDKLTVRPNLEVNPRLR